MIKELLNSVSIGEPQTYRNLSIYPLRIANGHPRSYLTLDEALKAGTFQVTEVSEGGSVPTLMVNNTGELPVLLVVGETLVGAKQNRVLNTSVLVPAASKIEIPVSCVEQGRWSYTSEHFSSGDSTSHMKLRKAQTRNVTESLRTRKTHDANQGEVWMEVDRMMASHEARSSTRSLHDVYSHKENDLKEYMDAFSAPDVEGILVQVNGKVAGADLFDHHETMGFLFPKLLRGYVMDALEDQQDDNATEDYNVFLQKSANANVEAYDAVGIGKDVRLSGEQITGSSLLWDDKVIHITLFTEDEK